MAKPCRVCIHDSRAAIEQAILAAKPAAAIARNFGFTYQSKGQAVGNHKVITAHRDGCMPTAYQKAMEEREVRSGVAMATRLEFLSNRNRDPHNYTGTVVKAIVDGLKRASLIPDDTAEWVTVLDPILAEAPRGRRPTATITITPRKGTT